MSQQHAAPEGERIRVPVSCHYRMSRRKALWWVARRTASCLLCHGQKLTRLVGLKKLLLMLSCQPRMVRTVFQETTTTNLVVDPKGCQVKPHARTASPRR